MSEPIWISQLIVEAIHQDQLKEHGGLPGIRDNALLESALERPKNKFAYDPTCSIHDLAAAYCYGLVRNHPFADGNKRIGFLVMAVFLELNGFTFRATEESTVVSILSLAAGDLSESDLASWIKENATPVQSG